MALFEEQITDTLETGAPPIKYEGDEGPKDPRQEQMLARLKEEYMQYVFEMKELEEPIMSFEEWYQSVYKASQMGVQAPQEEMMGEEMMMREPAAYGGIMDTESGRRAYGLGSFFKKITSPIKKVVKGAGKLLKSPVGKMGIAALLAGPALGALTGSGAATAASKAAWPGGMERFLGSATKSKGLKGLLNKAIPHLMKPKTLAKIGIGAASALPLLGIGTKTKQDQIENFGQEGKFDIDYGAMRKAAAGVDMDNPSELASFYETYGVTPGSLSLGSQVAADGGRIGYAQGQAVDFESIIENMRPGSMDVIEKIKEGIGKGPVGPFIDEAIWIEKIKDFIRKKRGEERPDPREDLIDPRAEIIEELNVFEDPRRPMRPIRPIRPMPDMPRRPMPDMPRRRRQGYALGSKADFALEDVMTGGVEDELGGITGIMRQADLQRKGNVGQFYAAEGGMPMMASYDYNDAMAESYDEFQRLRKLGEIPLDLEFDEWLEMQDVERHMKLPSEPRTMAREGGIMDLGGMEKDYRETGGFVDIGAEEKADDVPARLSVNEFVMTADAVRGAGDGDIDLGAERMEDTMKQLEQQGKRNQGASDMFEVSERLSEVI